MSGNPAAPGDAETVEVLRRVKAVEAEWEAKLRGAREEAERTVRRARDEAEATLKAVGAEVEGERARRLEGAQASSEAEAEAIRREGAKAADALRSGKDRRVSDRDDAIVAAVLGPFALD